MNLFLDRMLTHLENMGNRNFLGTDVVISILRTRSSEMSNESKDYGCNGFITHGLGHCMNEGSCLQILLYPQVYTNNNSTSIEGKRGKSYHSVYPTRRNDHGVALLKFDFENLIHHITKP